MKFIVNQTSKFVATRIATSGAAVSAMMMSCRLRVQTIRAAGQVSAMSTVANNSIDPDQEHSNKVARSDVGIGYCGGTKAKRNFTSINCHTEYQLCFLRHGQSTWNRDNRFIGWTDTPLTEDGVLEARLAGQMLQKSGMLFDEVHTSLLRRSIRTTNLALMEMGLEWIPVYKNWRLNERNYGDLVGKNKKEVVKLHGKDQVKRWRRSFDEPPPPMMEKHEYHPAMDPRYRFVSSRTRLPF